MDYVGFGTMQLGFTIFTKLFHSVQFSLLWSFLRKLLRRPLTAANKSKTEPFWLCFPHGLRFSYRLGHPPSFYSGVFPTAVINYFALYSEAGSLPRLKLRTAYAFFLTIRRSGFSSKENPPLYGSTTFRLQEELLNGQCPGERTDRAGLCKAHKARLCELERNPRQPTTNPQPVI